MALVLDTSALLAALDTNDPDHARCTKLIADSPEDLVIPALVLGELDYWCERRLGVDTWLVFLQDVVDGTYVVAHPTRADLERCHEIQTAYADLSPGVVDASVLALVERLGEPKLATLDHRHFGTMRPRHVEALELLPAGS